MNKKVLVVGGTGYLGQHLLQTFSDLQISPSYHLAFTYYSSPLSSKLLHAFPHSLSFPVDLQTGHGFDSITTTFGQVCIIFSHFISNEPTSKPSTFSLCWYVFFFFS